MGLVCMFVIWVATAADPHGGGSILVSCVFSSFYFGILSTDGKLLSYLGNLCLSSCCSCSCPFPLPVRAFLPSFLSYIWVMTNQRPQVKQIGSGGVQLGVSSSGGFGVGDSEQLLLINTGKYFVLHVTLIARTKRAYFAKQCYGSHLL